MGICGLSLQLYHDHDVIDLLARCARLCADTVARLKPSGGYRLTSICLASELERENEHTVVRLATVARNGQRNEPRVLAILIPYKVCLHAAVRAGPR